MSGKNRKIELYENYYGCWICSSHGRKSRFGYISYRYNNKEDTMHRYMYEKYKGKIPDRICVLHKCDNSMCVNPRHLFLGTKGDNAKDRSSKGRNYTKLKPEDINQIRISIKSQKELAIKYDVDNSQISRIQNYKAHLLEV